MCRKSSMRPTRKSAVLAAMTTRLSRVSGTNPKSAATVAMAMATPPSIAVGFECQRSLFGLATAPMRRAKAATSGVNASDAMNAATAALTRGAKLFFLVCDHGAEDVVERRRRREPDEAQRLRGVGDAARHVLE